MTVGLIITAGHALLWTAPWLVTSIFKLCRRIIINLSKVRNSFHFITVITATWRRRRRRNALCTELASALFTTIISLTATELVISPWTMAMLEWDMVKNEECRTVLLIVYAVFKSLAFWDPHIKRKLSYRKDDRAMVPWKFSRAPEYAHGYFSRNFKWVFVAIYPVTTKFEVRSFTRSWDNSDWNFGEFLFVRFPTYVILSHQRHRQTDGRHAISIPRFAL